MPQPLGLASVLGVWRRRLAERLGGETPAEAAPPPVPLSDDHSLPLYLQAQGGRLQRDGELLRLHVDGAEAASAPLAEVSEVVLVGPVAVTTPCLHALLRADIPVAWLKRRTPKLWALA